jgi:hypothetical protein
MKGIFLSAGLSKWGPLAYVDEAERRRILDLGFGLMKPEVERLEKEIKAMQKKGKEKESE